MEHKYGWERLDEHLLVRFARVGRVGLLGLWLRKVCECVLDGVCRIILCEEFGGWSSEHMCR